MRRTVAIAVLAGTSSLGCGGDSHPSPSAPIDLDDLPSGYWVEALAFSGDSKTLWGASENQIGSSVGETLAWTLPSNTKSASLDGPSWSVSLDPTSAQLAVGGTTDTIVDTATAQVTQTLANTQGAAAYSPDGQWIAAVSSTSGEVDVLSASNGSMVAQLAHPVEMNERIWRVTWSPDGSMLVTASGQNGLGSPHGSTLVWRTSDWSQLHDVTCTTLDAAFSPDGGTIALACWLYVKLVSTSDFSEQTVAFSGQSMAIAYSTDGAKLAVGGFMAGIQVYGADLAPLVTLTDGTVHPTVKAIAWSPDGKWLAGGGWDDATVRLWSAP